MKRDDTYNAYLVPVTDIDFDPDFNCRGAFSPQSVSDLAHSIKQHGLQTPVTVRPRPVGRFVLLAGHRRFEAVTTLLKWNEIPAVIRDNLTEHQAKIFNLTENLERKDLNMMEEALALQKLYPEGVTLRRASGELRRPTRWVQCRLKLLTLSPVVQKWASTGHLSALNIETISKMKESEQVEAVGVIIKHKETGKTKAFRGKYQRTFKYRKTKGQVVSMIEHLYNVHCEGVGCRLLAWTMGRMPDNVIEEEIRNDPNYRDPGPNYHPPYTENRHPEDDEEDNAYRGN